MKTLIGVDAEETFVRALKLTSALGLPRGELSLVHCIETVSFEPVNEALPPRDAVDALLVQAERRARDALLNAERHARELGFSHADAHLVRGVSPANELIKHATASRADLIGVGCRMQGRIQAMLFGSVSRKLVISAPASLCVAKRDVDPHRPLRAVLATDHSPYMARCVDQLLAWSPRGIGEILIVSAVPRALFGPEFATAYPVAGMGTGGDALGAWSEDSLRKLNAGLQDRLSGLGCKVRARVVGAGPSEAIAAAVSETRADIVIVGAQGHGFMERVVMGSVSMNEVVGTEHNVLVLRPR